MTLKITKILNPDFTILGDPVFCLEDGDTLWAKSSDSTLSWNWNGMGNKSFLPIDSTGSYKLIANDTNGCMSQDSLSIRGILCYVSTMELNEEQALNVFPNPSSDILHISLNEGEIKKVELFHQNGTLVEEMEQAKDYELNVQELSQGVYFLRVHTTNQVIHSSIVVN